MRRVVSCLCPPAGSRHVSDRIGSDRRRRGRRPRATAAAGEEQRQEAYQATCEGSFHASVLLPALATFQIGSGVTGGGAAGGPEPPPQPEKNSARRPIRQHAKGRFMPLSSCRLSPRLW